MESVKWGSIFKKTKPLRQLQTHGNGFSQPSPAGSFSDRYLERGRTSDSDKVTGNLFYREHFFRNSIQTERPLQNGNLTSTQTLWHDPEKTNLHDQSNGYTAFAKQPNDSKSDQNKSENQSLVESEGLEKDQNFEHFHSNYRKIASTWDYLDLKNRKQTGDLYRAIVTISKKEKSRIFAFTSSRHREGVSTIIVNLVSYMNEQMSGKKLLIIDANLQAPSLKRLFNIPDNCYGLMDIFSDRATPDESIIQISNNQYLLCSGKITNNESKNVMDQDGLNRLFAYSRNRFDYVLVDTPPVLSSPDSLTLASTTDKVFLVIQYAKVQRPVAEKSKGLLHNNECQVAGVILNRVKQVIPGWVYKYI